MLAKITNIKSAIAANTPTLATIKNKLGNDVARAYVVTWIVDLNRYLGYKDLDKYVLEEQARLIVNNFPNITIADIYLIFNNAKMGVYGKFFNKVDGSAVLTWFREYFAEKYNVSRKTMYNWIKPIREELLAMSPLKKKRIRILLPKQVKRIEEFLG